MNEFEECLKDEMERMEKSFKKKINNHEKEMKDLKE